MDVPVGLLGGSLGNVGGIDVGFDDVATGGELSARFERIDASAFEGRFGVTPDLSGIAIPGQETFSIWDPALPDGEFGTAALRLRFAANDLPTGFDETRLALWHFNAGLGVFEPLPTLGIDSVAGILSASTAGFRHLYSAPRCPCPAACFCLHPRLRACLPCGAGAPVDRQHRPLRDVSGDREPITYPSGIHFESGDTALATARFGLRGTSCHDSAASFLRRRVSSRGRVRRTARYLAGFCAAPGKAPTVIPSSRQSTR